MDSGVQGVVRSRRQPAFIRENALADPRTKHVEELGEERFQSLLAVPVVGRSADVIGVITARTETDWILGWNGSA